MIYFVSGHRDLSYEDFEKYYIPKIEAAIREDLEAEFVVGDCDGVDKYAIDCFKDICYTDSKDETGAYGQWNISIKKPLQRN